jgi:prepilin-type N-terminal cleavage/methylation domain-containing protein
MSLKRGFENGHTLPEVLTVITLIGLLAGIAAPSYLAVVGRVRCLSFGNLESIKPNCNPEAQITEPGNGKVSMNNEFRGTFKNLPLGTTMWIYVYAPGEGKFYCDQVSNFNKLMGTWKLENVVIGEDGDNNATYIVGIFIAGPEGTMELRSEPDGRDDLPSGKKLSEVKMVRE